MLGGFFGAEALDIAHDEDGAEAGGKLADGGFEDATHFLTRHFGLRVEGHADGWELDDLCALAAFEVDLLEAGGRAAAPQALRGFVDRDAGQPGAELGIAAKPSRWVKAFT